MATAKKLKSGSWRCQVYSHTEDIIQPDGTTKKKRIYKSFTCDVPGPKGKRMCERMAADWAENKEAQQNIENITFGEAIDKYIESRSSVLSPSTIREYKRTRNHDLKEIIQVKLADIDQNKIQIAVNKEAVTHSPKTVRNMHGIISAVLSAYRPDLALKTDLPKKVRVNVNIPSDEQIQRIMSHVKSTNMEIPILLAAFGPMRRSEICALDSNHVSGNIVHVEKAMVLDSDGNWVIKSPKSYAGDRYIEFPDFVIQKMEGRTGRIVEITPGTITHKFRKILDELDIPPFRFHDLRHYSASILHAIGIPDAYIMQRGGWGNDNVLKSVYRHTMRQAEKEMADKANAYFSDLCNTKCNTKQKSAVK